MRDVQLRIHVPDADSADLFEKVGDFARYPELVDVVRSVDVYDAVGDDRISSNWVVYFRNGLLRWSEVDTYNAAQLTIDFEQTTGDFEVFHGAWRVEAAGSGCNVLFDAEFDFGIPSLAGILDPIASRVLKENIARVIIGLTGTSVLTDDEQLAKAVGAEVGLHAVA